MVLPSNTELKALIHTLVPRWQPEVIAGLDYLPGGYSNHNFRFHVGEDCYVLRAPGQNVNMTAIRREQEFYQRCQGRQSPLHIPRLVALDAETGAMISEWQAGPLLVDQPTTPERLVSYLREMHEHLPSSRHHYDPIATALQYLKQGDPEDDILALARDLRWAPEEVRTCHNDLNPWNIICASTERWTTLDWEWHGRNDPLFDLITLHQGLNWSAELLPDMAEAFLGVEVPVHRLHSMMQAFWLREYAWAHAAIADGNSRAEVIEQKQLARQQLSALSG